MTHQRLKKDELAKEPYKIIWKEWFTWKRFALFLVMIVVLLVIALCMAWKQ